MQSACCDRVTHWDMWLRGYVKLALHKELFCRTPLTHHVEPWSCSAWGLRIWASSVCSPLCCYRRAFVYSMCCVALSCQCVCVCVCVCVRLCSVASECTCKHVCCCVFCEWPVKDAAQLSLLVIPSCPLTSFFNLWRQLNASSKGLVETRQYDAQCYSG